MASLRDCILDCANDELIRAYEDATKHYLDCHSPLLVALRGRQPDQYEEWAKAAQVFLEGAIELCRNLKRCGKFGEEVLREVAGLISTVDHALRKATPVLLGTEGREVAKDLIAIPLHFLDEPRDHPLPEAKKKSEGGKPRAKGKNINGRMAKMLQSDPQKLQWSARMWAECLECSEGTVKGTFTWKQTVKAARALNKADRMQRPKRSR